MVRKSLAALLLHATLAIAAPENCGRFPAPGFDGPDMDRHTGNYANPTYRYSVRIPDGLAGFSAPPPAPHHGFGVVLSWEPRAYIYFDGSYNALDDQDSDEVANRHLQWLGNDAEKIIAVRKQKVRFKGAPASRYVARIACKGLPGEFVEDMRFVLRDGIVYSAGLLTTADRYRRDSAIFESMLRSWHHQH
jgi:hypothetical protein